MFRPAAKKVSVLLVRRAATQVMTSERPMNSTKPPIATMLGPVPPFNAILPGARIAAIAVS